MAKFINLTPHTITLRHLDIDRMVYQNFQPSGDIARLDVGVIDIDGFPFPAKKRVFGKIIGLPKKKKNTFFIVSAMVMAKTKRTDTIAPNTSDGVIRDSNGRITAITSFIVN